jgi:hypothetical protein
MTDIKQQKEKISKGNKKLWKFIVPIGVIGIAVGIGVCIMALKKKPPTEK